MTNTKQPHLRVYIDAETAEALEHLKRHQAGEYSAGRGEQLNVSRLCQEAIRQAARGGGWTPGR